MTIYRIDISYFAIGNMQIGETYNIAKYITFNSVLFLNTLYKFTYLNFRERLYVVS